MKKFKVYFEIYGKKLCTTVSAVSEHDAKNIVSSKIKFHKFVEEKQTLSDLEKEFEKLCAEWGL